MLNPKQAIPFAILCLVLLLTGFKCHYKPQHARPPGEPLPEPTVLHPWPPEFD